MMHGRFRWKSILFLVGSCALLGAGWFFLHKHQMKVMHGEFLEQATRAEERKPPQYDRAARFLRQYLLVKPDDVDALVRFGILAEKLAGSPKARRDALGVYERLLLLDGSRQDIRMRAAKLSMEFRRIEAALGHLDFLQKTDQDNPEVALLLGDCKRMKKEPDKAKQQVLWNEAESHYRKAISRAPQKLEAYARLAQLLKDDQKKPLNATQILEDLIRANGQESRAYLVRAGFRQNGDDRVAEARAALAARMVGLVGSPLGQGPFLSIPQMLAPKTGKDIFGAGQDLARARELAPDDLEVLLMSASHELLAAMEHGQKNSKSRLDEARVYLERAGRLKPDDLRVLPLLAAVELAAGRRTEALDLLRTAQKKARGPERNRLLWDLATLLIDADGFTEAKEIIHQMTKGGEPTARLDFLRARIAIRQGQWHEAAGLLEAARPMLVDNPALVMQTDLLLGYCFDRLGNADQQILIYQRARRLDPFNAAPHLGLATAYAALGRLDDAIDECQALRQARQYPIDGDFLYARLLIVKNLRSAVANWDEVKSILNWVVEKDSSKELEVDLLRAEMAAARGDTKEAKEILNSAKKKRPEDVEPWTALANLEAAPEALKILEEAATKFRDRPELRLAKLRCVPEKKAAALAFLRPLADGIDGFDRSHRLRLLVGLAEAFEYAGDLPQAENAWQKLAELEPTQLGIRLVLFDYYLRTENPTGMQKAVEAIKTIEGADADGPLFNYGNAQFLIFHATKRLRQLAKAENQLTQEEKDLRQLAKAENQLTQEEKDLTKEARRHLFRAQAKRPLWSRISVSLATIADLEGEKETAVMHLREAVARGNRQLAVIKALVAALMDNRQYAEADEVLRKLQELAPITDINLQMREAEISIKNRNIARALDLTQKVVAKDSKDYREHLWQGLMLGELKEAKKAEASLRTAIKLAPDDPGPWVALIQLQARTRQTKQTLETLEKMKAELSASKLSIALAHCYQAMGEKDKAEKAFKQALNVESKDLASRKNDLQSMVKFHLSQGRPKDAELYLRQMLEGKLNASEEMHQWARRNLALAMGSQEGADKHSEAMALIEENLKTNLSSVDDQLVKGILLAGKPGGRPDAIRLLENAFKIRKPSADQMFILANLYYNEGNWPKAHRQMVTLLTTHASHEKYMSFLTAFIDKLLVHNQTHEAEVWIPRLQESIKNYLETKESEFADPLATRMALATYLLTDLVRRHPRLAPKILPDSVMLKSFAGKTGKKETLLAFAEFLGTCQSLEDSLNLCDEVRRELPPEQVLAVAVTSVVSNAASPKQLQRVEAWVESARKQKPNLVEWDVYLALLRERQERYGDAEALYRKVLTQDPNNLMAANNLAFLLGLQRQGDEAYALIQKLITKVGPAGEFLDSRAVILRGQGKLPEAEKDLQVALLQQKTAYRLYHLAEVHQAAGRTKESNLVFREAVREGLRPEMMHALERERYQKLLQQQKQAN